MKTIALILESNREYGRELLKGIARFAYERKDWRLKLIPQLAIDLKSLLHGCAGVISRVTDPDAMRGLLALKLPIIDLFRQGRPSTAIRVGCDNGAIASMAAKHFLRRGFKNFAFCGYRGTRYSDERSAAFLKTLVESGMACDEYPAVEKPSDIISYGDQTMRPRNIRRFAAWVEALPPKTAVFCANDIRAYHVLRVCIDIGRGVPSDIAIMGVDNDPVLCSCAPVPLTSIDPNASSVGYAAAQLLDAAIEHADGTRREAPTLLVKPAGVVERRSTAAYPVNLPWLTKALTFVDENMGKSITTGDLVRMSNVSQSALQKVFKKVFGVSAGRYILGIKMREARRLAETGNMLVKEIAAAVGFSSPKYFCRTYHAYFGHIPSRAALSRLNRI